MIRSMCVGLLVALAAAAAPSMGTGQAAQEPTQPPAPTSAADLRDAREGHLGVGLQLTWPTFGLSGMMDVSDDFSIQGVIGTAGYGLALSGRGLYRLEPQEHFRPYVYGEAGLWSAYRDFGAVPNIGAGLGLEVDLRQFLPEAPPVYLAFEAGLNFAFYNDPDLGSGSLTRFQIGPAAHYRF